MAGRSALLEEEKCCNSDNDEDNQTSDGDHAGPSSSQASWMIPFLEWITVGPLEAHERSIKRAEERRSVSWV